MNVDVDRAEAICRRLDAAEPIVVEVGVAAGMLSLEILRRDARVRLFMVDDYLPGLRRPDRYRATGDCHAYDSVDARWQDASRRCAERRTRGYSGPRRTIIIMSSINASATMPDESLDLVFLDADHSYDGVREDIKSWWPKIRPGGWLSGHDYDGYSIVAGERRPFGVKAAVDDWIETEWLVSEIALRLELDVDNTWFVRKEER